MVLSFVCLLLFTMCLFYANVLWCVCCCWQCIVCRLLMVLWGVHCVLVCCMLMVLWWACSCYLLYALGGSLVCCLFTQWLFALCWWFFGVFVVVVYCVLIRRMLMVFCVFVLILVVLVYCVLIRCMLMVFWDDFLLLAVCIVCVLMVCWRCSCWLNTDCIVYRWSVIFWNWGFFLSENNSHIKIAWLFSALYNWNLGFEFQISTYLVLIPAVRNQW